MLIVNLASVMDWILFFVELIMSWFNSQMPAQYLPIELSRLFFCFSRSHTTYVVVTCPHPHHIVEARIVVNTSPHSVIHFNFSLQWTLLIAHWLLLSISMKLWRRNDLWIEWREKTNAIYSSIIEMRKIYYSTDYQKTILWRRWWRLLSIQLSARSPVSSYSYDQICLIWFSLHVMVKSNIVCRQTGLNSLKPEAKFSSRFGKIGLKIIGTKFGDVSGLFYLHRKDRVNKWRVSSLHELRV